MRLVKFTLLMTVLTILVCLSMIIGIAVTYNGDTPDSEIGGAGEEFTPPAIDIQLSIAVTPDADGKVPAGGATASDDNAVVTIPEGVQMAEGATSLTLTVTSLEETKSDVTTKHRNEVLHSMDVHIDGVSTSNTVPMSIQLNGILPTGLNSNNVKLYHVENGETVAMTLVDTPVNHNEFSYNPLTGDAVITIASFSEIVAFGDTIKDWNGETIATKFNSGTGTEADPYIIANAEEFVYFRNEVDGGRNFDGEFVKLTANINLNRHNFDPIGWGYVNSAWNRKDADGKPIAGKAFQGTFDGGIYDADGNLTGQCTIYGLYQNGWDLESSTGTDYTYTNCGGGLFAAAHNATFKNLKIDGADIRFECVEIGVLVGLAQGSCTFENINIAGCKIANYQRPTGGVVGEVSPNVVDGTSVESKHTFKDIYVDSNTVVGSMWGDFDAPVGGVIGAYWDDAGATAVEMENVTVACRLDVYNDVTSTYQWYAYRRAGMLIGNTDRAEGHTATAPFLECSNVTVCYGEWTKYNYCEFKEANPKWPWVRVEAGENCNGYSNPRWGRPIDPKTGNPVTDSVHSHGEGEGHMLELEFHQLYGGGQGVYGEETHEGVTEGQLYTVTYMDKGEILHVDYVPSNLPYTLDDIWSISNVDPGSGDPALHWVDANNVQFEGFNAGHTANAIVYPKWPDEYTIRCLDAYGDVAYYAFVTVGGDDTKYQAIADEINNTLITIQDEIDKDKKVMIMVWKLVDGDDNEDNDKFYVTKNSDNTIDVSITVGNIKEVINQGSDFIIEAVPQLQETSIRLEKYYDPTTGELVAYHVTEVAQDDKNTSVVIPDYVIDIPVTVISAGAAEGFDKLHATTIPDTIEKIGDNAFAGKPTINRITGQAKGEQQTIYYDGDPTKFNEQLQKHLDEGESEMFSRLWDSGLGTGTRIFFLKEGKVDPNAGYWELTELKIEKTGNIISGYTIKSEEYVWTYYASVSSGFTENYAGTCDCGCGTRPDQQYWLGVFDKEQ